ncbi:tax1-binding protein 1 homolog A-like, partial [Polyodon spathula]|uniref:tax1-binding protein 1 homolog A-like n=1 Tax=Polyodon spathula TaxID=7913 RepID=UPI001B7D979C
GESIPKSEEGTDFPPEIVTASDTDKGSEVESSLKDVEDDTVSILKQAIGDRDKQLSSLCAKLSAAEARTRQLEKLLEQTGAPGASKSHEAQKTERGTAAVNESSSETLTELSSEASSEQRTSTVLHVEETSSSVVHTSTSIVTVERAVHHQQELTLEIREDGSSLQDSSAARDQEMEKLQAHVQELQQQCKEVETLLKGELEQKDAELRSLNAVVSESQREMEEFQETFRTLEVENKELWVRIQEQTAELAEIKETLKTSKE